MLAVLLVLSIQLHAQDYKYLVLKGGGIRGIAYVGAFKVMEEKSILPGIEKVAGTSVGAITGALLCLGYSAAQMEAIMRKTVIAGFNDGEWFFIGGQKRMRRNFGWYKGRKLEEWIGKLVAARTGNAHTTLLQLHQLALIDRKFKDLYVTATNLSRQRLDVFSWETHPNMPVAAAVRASASIPLYYGAVFLDSLGNPVEHPKKDVFYDVYVDGGLMANYPLQLFNSGEHIPGEQVCKNTLGLKLERPEQISYYTGHTGIAPYDIHTLPTYIAALYNLTIEQLNRNVAYEQERRNTIYISTGNLSPRVRHISDDQKQLLFDNGEQAARKFFDGK